MSSYPVTRAKLITRVNQRANTSGYVEQTTELPQLIDTSCAKLHNLLACELYEDYYQKHNSFQLVTNASTYALPSDFLKLRAVFCATPSSGQSLDQAPRYALQRIDPSQQTQGVMANNYPALPFSYSLAAQALTIFPTPGSGTQNWITYYYIPQYVPPLNNEQQIEFAFAFGWDEWLVNDVAVQIRHKAMMPATELVAERDAFLERLRIQAKNRNAAQPPRVVDTGWRYGNNNGSPWGTFAFRG